MWNDKRGDMVGTVYGRKGHVVLVTACQEIDHKNRLMIGHSAGWELRRAMLAKTSVDLAVYAGKWVKGLTRNLGKRPYGIKVFKKARMGLFQTRYYYYEDSHETLIRLSATKLLTILKRYPNMKFHLNYPGIVFGGMSHNRVEPILNELFKDVKNLYIWQYYEDVEEFDD